MALQDSTFNTSHVLENEIIKANDFEFAFEMIAENVAKATQMMLESTQDFVINGKVSPFSGMNVQVSPIYGVCKSTGIPFGRTENSEAIGGFAESASGRVDILEVQGDWETYDNQQRAFNDPDTNVQTYQYVNTKKLMKPIYKVKPGVEGSSVAPEVDEGWVKIAEVVIRANNSTITENDIKNITADVAGLDNEDWTTEPDITYNIGYISDVNARFRVAHKENGEHSENCINTDSLNIGIGSKQINGNVLPIGSTTDLTIPNYTPAASDTIFTVIQKSSLIIASLYNAYLKFGGAYKFNGELCVSDLADSGTNVLTNPIKISANGSGSATIKIGNNTVLSIDPNGRLSTNGYQANSANHIITKSVTDNLDTRLTNLANYVADLALQIDTSFYANASLSTGTNGRYNVDSTAIYIATTENITLSGSQIIDTVSITESVLVLVKDQTDATENGIYSSNPDGVWSRASSYLTPALMKAKIFTVTNGTANKGRMFYLPRVNFQDDSDFGTDNIEIYEYFGSIQPKANRLVMRDANACVKAAEPNSSNDVTTRSYVDPVLASSANISGPALKANMSLKIMFTQNIDGSNTSTALVLNYNSQNVPIKVAKNGSLVDLYAHEIATDTYRYIQAYTTLEVIYNNGNFVVVGNPIVLSSSNYTVYASGKVGDEPIGGIRAFYSNNAPYGFLACDGSTFNASKYPDLYTYLGSNVLPDFREVSLVGIGKNETFVFESPEINPNTGTAGTQNHNVYTLGQFMDDQFQGHWHAATNTQGSGSQQCDMPDSKFASVNLYRIGATFPITDRTNGVPRYGTTTHSKQIGILYCIKAL